MGIVEPTKRGNLSQHQRKIIVALIRLDKGFFIGGKEAVAKLYTKEDLLVKNKIFANISKGIRNGYPYFIVIIYVEENLYGRRKQKRAFGK